MMRIGTFALGLAAATLALSACGEEGRFVPGGRDEAARPAGDAPGRAPHPLRALFECLMARDEAVIAAHRGGAYPGFPENAIETFAFTLALGPSILEVDIRQTADGELVLMHDETLDRTTNGAGAVADTPYADFSDLLLKDAEGILTAYHPPRLADALYWARGRAVLELDIKGGVDLAAVIDAVAAAGAQADVIYIAYTPLYAARIHAADPAALISAPISTLADLEALEALGAPPPNILAWTGTRAADPALNAALEARGIPALFGSLAGLDEQYAADGDLSEYAALARDGVTLISTAAPDAAHRALSEAGANTCANSSEG